MKLPSIQPTVPNIVASTPEVAPQTGEYRELAYPGTPALPEPRFDLVAEQAVNALADKLIAALPAEVAVPDTLVLKKLARSQMTAWKAKHLKLVQGGLCPLCGKVIDLRIKGEGVIDHDHDTGRIRGILHRSCNAAEGKVSNAAARWGAKASDYPSIIKYLESIVRYLRAEPTRIIYPFHQDASAKKLTRAKLAKEARARRAAKAKLAKESA